MPAHLGEIKIVDLENSEWDKEQSDRSKGKYVFTDKRHIDYRSPRVVKPRFIVKSHRNSPDVIMGLQYSNYEWTLLTTEDNYWPEGLVPNATGNYVFKDAIFMKCPVTKYLENRRAEILRSENAPKMIQNQMKAEAAHYGIGLSDEELGKMMSVRKG